MKDFKLEERLKNCKSEEEKFNIFLEYAEKSIHLSFEKALNYIEQAEKIKSEKISSQNYIKLQILKALIFRRIGKIKSALVIYDRLLENSSLTEKQSADILHNRGICFIRKGDSRKALKLLQTALEMRIELGSKIDIADSYLALGAIFFQKFDLLKSLNLIKEAYTILSETNQDEKKANAANWLGLIYEKAKVYDSSLSYYMEALEKFLKIDHNLGICNTYNNIGLLYFKTEKYKDAEMNLKSAVEYAEKVANKQVIAHALNNLGLIYQEKKDFKKALDFFEKSLKHRPKDAFLFDHLTTTANIAYVNFELRDFNSCLKNINKAVALAHKIDDNKYFIQALILKAKIFIEKQEFTKVKVILKQALKNVKKERDDFVLKDLYDIICTYYEEQSLFKKAYIWSKKRRNLIDHLSIKDTKTKLDDIKEKYEIVKRAEKSEIYEKLNKKIFSKERKVEKFSEEIKALERQNTVLAMASTINSEIRKPVSQAKANLKILKTVPDLSANTKLSETIQKIDSLLTAVNKLLDKYQNISEANLQ